LLRGRVAQSCTSLCLHLTSLLHPTPYPLPPLLSLSLSLPCAATKLSTSVAAAEEQWREHFPRDEASKEDGSGEEGSGAGEGSGKEASEKLLNFFFCNLQLNVGLCPGTLFVTTSSLYFLSDNELEYNIDEEEVASSHYKVCTCPGKKKKKVDAAHELECDFNEEVPSSHYRVGGHLSWQKESKPGGGCRGLSRGLAL